jgi:hypothetical protein
MQSPARLTIRWMDQMQATLLDLIVKTHAIVDRKGEAHTTCPACGHTSDPRHPHFSFSQKGAHCFSCGYSAGLQGYAKLVGITEIKVTLTPRAQAQPPTWLSQAGGLVDKYTTNPQAWDKWQAYKKVSRPTFESHRLGLGILPLSPCHHPRLIVPIMRGTEIVGLRGRRIACDCAKWLAPKDTSIELYPLYNAEPEPRGIVFITENPVDALMIGDAYPLLHGVATYSTSYWYPHWEQQLSQAEMVVVAFDNDLPGCGGGCNREKFIKEWLLTHPLVPEARGIKLVNRLLEIGLPARLYDWGDKPSKFDMGDLLNG